MRAFAVLAILASTALAATLPRDDVSAPATVTLDEATESQLFDCKCPKDNYKDAGVHINQSLLWYQCAYPNGACQWNVFGFLVNDKQTNCPTFSPCIIFL